jgi:hypothetical protein
METEAVSPFDALLWASVTGGSFCGLGDAVNQARRDDTLRSVAVTVETVFTESGHPFDLMKPSNMLHIERQSGPGVELLRFLDSEGQWVLAAFTTEHPGVFQLLSSLPTTHPRWKRVERWIGAARGVLRCFLNHQDFESIGNHLARIDEVEVVRMTARVIGDFSSITRGFPSRSGAPRPTHLDAIAEAEGMVAAVNTLTLHVGDVVTLHLRRLAGATYYSGDFDLFQHEVMSRLADAAAGRRTLMTGRQRQYDKPVRPITIQLDRPILATASDTGAVIDLIGTITNCTLAVFHRNPYLHMAVTDEIDGSNFDVMVTEADAIEVYPGYRASMAALSRLTQQLGERFGATEILDSVATVVTLEELLNG